MRKILVSAVIFGSALALSACVHAPTEEQMAQAQTHILPVSERDFVAAANRVFAASRDNEYVVTASDGTMLAHHGWSQYTLDGYSDGSDDWKIRYWPTKEGLLVSLIETAYFDGFLATKTTIVNPLANYDLFWARLDYALARRSDWPSCDIFQEKMTESHYAEGTMQNLCGPRAAEDSVLARKYP